MIAKAYSTAGGMSYHAAWKNRWKAWLFQCMRRGLCSFLCFLWIFTLHPSVAHAQFSYKIINSGIIGVDSEVTITGYNGPGGTIRIPATAEGLLVTGVERNAFFKKANITRVIVPASVKYMYRSAFYGCTNIVGAYFYGNAPEVRYIVGVFNTGVFDYGTVYYLPGTTGWGSWFGGHPERPEIGRPTASWRPEMITNDTSFGVRTNRMGFNIFWTSGSAVIIDACANLTNPVWQPVKTNVLLAETAYFSDPQWMQFSRRSYRLRAVR